MLHDYNCGRGPHPDSRTPEYITINSANNYRTARQFKCRKVFDYLNRQDVIDQFGSQVERWCRARRGQLLINEISVRWSLTGNYGDDDNEDPGDDEQEWTIRTIKLGDGSGPHDELDVYYGQDLANNQWHEICFGSIP